MNTPLKNFLLKHIASSVFFTHVSMIEPYGKYGLNREHFDEFWEIYNKEYSKNGGEFIVGVAEKPEGYLPVLGDIDIKILEDDIDNYEITDNHLYTKENLNQVVEIFQKVLRETIDGCTDENLLCVVLEKNMYLIDKGGKRYYKSGFHLQMVNTFLSKGEHENQIIPRIQHYLQEENVFQNLDIDDSSTVLDTGYIKTPWLLYGSRKSKDMEPYKISKIINSEGKELTIEEAFKSYEMFDARGEIINIANNLMENLPRILSIFPLGRKASELKCGLPSIIKEKYIKKYKNIRYDDDEDDENEDENYKVIPEQLLVSKRLLPMLSNYRAEDRNEWIRIGWIMYCVGDGCQEALEQWLDFSSRDEDKYDEDECIKLWKNMTRKDYTIASLHYLAQIDNEEAYNLYKKENSKTLVKNILEGCGSHNDVAKIMYVLYGREFVCSSIANKTWYEYNGNQWEMSESGIGLQKKISNQILNIFCESGGEIYKEMGIDVKSNQSLYLAKQKELNKQIISLKNASYKSNIMKEANEVFYDGSFKNKLDINAYLIGFKNGVYDLQLNKFRKGRPDDYISKCMPIKYNANYKHTDKEVLEVYDFLEKVFPNKAIREYFLDQSSDVFEGGNKHKILVFWTGEGDNGKSVTQTIIEKMLGPYAIKFSTTLVTGKKIAAGAAGPEIARSGGGVRWAVIEEPDQDEELNTGMLKSITGSDSQYARDLFQKGSDTREFTPLFKTTFICNKLPAIKKADKAFWNRTKIIPFESTFVRPGEPCPETYEEQLRQKRFPMDIEFNKKIPKLLEPFAWVLLEHRKSIQGKGRIEPEEVREAINRYKKQNDIYRQFYDESIIKAEQFVSVNELYEKFVGWYKTGFSKHLNISKMDIQDYFTKIWGEPDKFKWYGYRVKTFDEEVEDQSAIILGDDNKKSAPPV